MAAHCFLTFWKLSAKCNPESKESACNNRHLIQLSKRLTVSQKRDTEKTQKRLTKRDQKNVRQRKESEGQREGDGHRERETKRQKRESFVHCLALTDSVNQAAVWKASPPRSLHEGARSGTRGEGGPSDSVHCTHPFW